MEQIDYRRATLAGGPVANSRRYMRRVTGSGSLPWFLWQGTVLTCLTNLPTVGGSVLRGRLYRWVLGSVGRGCFIEPGVRFLVPRRVFLGRRVMVGQDTFIDAHSLRGRIELADDVWLSRGCCLVTDEGAEVQIGRSAYLGHRCLLYGHGGIRLGQDVLLANDVQLICGDHTFARRDLPIRAQPTVERPIVIEDDVWLGASVIVLGGVTVGRGTVVGAGAVVTRDLPPYSLARGIPAQVVGSRGTDTPMESVF